MLHWHEARTPLRSAALHDGPRRSLELTFDEDVEDPATLEAEVTRMARELCG